MRGGGGGLCPNVAGGEGGGGGGGFRVLGRQGYYEASGSRVRGLG